MKLFSGLFFVLFIVFAVVQYNDPDPWTWIAVYLFCALASAYAFTGRFHLPVLLAASVVLLVLAFVLFPGDTGAWLQAEQHNQSLVMELPWIEEARESVGLMISAAVLMVYFTYGLIKKRTKQQ